MFDESNGAGLDDGAIMRLRDAARDASRRAYVPYSKFPVGAVAVSDLGETFSGCNVENASYGLTICGERNAIFHAVASGARRLRAVVIYTPTAVPSAPCGACRQVINEFGPDAEVVSFCDGPDVLRGRLSDFLPHAFGPHNLAGAAGAAV